MDNNFNNGFNNDFNNDFNNQNYKQDYNQSYSQNYNPNNQNYNEFNGGNMNFAPQQPVKDPGHGLAVASLVVGIVSLLTCCCCGALGIPVSIAGIVLALVSKSKSNTGTMETMAKAGFILSIVGLVLTIGYLIIYAVMGLSEASMNMLEMYEEMLKSN